VTEKFSSFAVEDNCGWEGGDGAGDREAAGDFEVVCESTVLIDEDRRGVVLELH
jgi:hypothetical protein